MYKRSDWGEIAYKVEMKYRHEPSEPIKTSVNKVGVKYITIKHQGRYFVETGRPEETWRGYYLLFPTLEAANEFVHREQLYCKICPYLNYDGERKAMSMSNQQLEQLRDIFGSVT